VVDFIALFIKKVGVKYATNVLGSPTLPGFAGGDYNTDRMCIQEKVIK